MYTISVNYLYNILYINPQSEKQYVNKIDSPLSLACACQTLSDPNVSYYYAINKGGGPLQRFSVDM